MTPKTTFNLTGATREDLSFLYLESLGNPDTRRMHALLPNGQISIESVRVDLRTWYSGVLSLARAIDPDARLTKWSGEIDGLITKGFVEECRGVIEKAA